jgi:hypothetical protein
MTALIIGGDCVDPLKREIRARGHERVEHWSGRKTGFAKRAIPARTRLVVVLFDYVNHNLVHALKQQAGRVGIPVIFCRRSATDLRRCLAELEGANVMWRESEANRAHERTPANLVPELSEFNHLSA